MDNSVHGMRAERTQDIIISASTIFFHFGLLYHFLVFMSVLFTILVNGNMGKFQVLFWIVGISLVFQLFAFPILKTTILYGRLVLLLNCIIFTIINLLSARSIYLILFLPMCVLCILFFDRVFTVLVCGVGLLNVLIQLSGMLVDTGSLVDEYKDFVIIAFTCAMFSVAVAMVNRLVGYNFEVMLKNLKKENRLQRKFYEKSNYDSTTDLLNRNAYNEYLESFDDTSLSSICCVYVDVNGLHEYNNAFGHLEGDYMLHKVACCIKQNFEGDKAYRIGGDEFVIICENTTFREVIGKLKAFKEEVKENKVHIATGLEWRDNNMDIVDMIKSADAKMYQDKKKFYDLYPEGRNNVVLYERAVR